MSDEGCGCLAAICAGAAVVFLGGTWIARKTASETREAVASAVSSAVSQALASASANAPSAPASVGSCSILCTRLGTGNGKPFVAEHDLTPARATLRARELAAALNVGASRDNVFYCSPIPTLECSAKE
jgi:hypothetical protein